MATAAGSDGSTPPPPRPPSPAGSDGGGSSSSSDGSGLLDCVLCLKLLHQPVTTACGHSFCRPCLVRALDHVEACPLCRAPIHMAAASAHPVSLSLAAAVAALHPRRAAARAAAAAAEAAAATVDGQGSVTSLPLFLLPLTVFPGGACPLNVFEPRYRVMMRRVLAGSRRFGLLHPPRRSFLGGALGSRRTGGTPAPSQDATASSGGGGGGEGDGGAPGVTVNPATPPAPADVGSLLEVTAVNTHADGRYTIATVCRGRFRVLDRCELDGYVVGRVQVLQDEEEVEEEGADASVAAVAADATADASADAAANASTDASAGADADGAAGASAPSYGGGDGAPAGDAASADAAGAPLAGGNGTSAAGGAAASSARAGSGSLPASGAAKPPTPVGGTAAPSSSSGSASSAAAAQSSSGEDAPDAAAAAAAGASSLPSPPPPREPLAAVEARARELLTTLLTASTAGAGPLRAARLAERMRLTGDPPPPRDGPEALSLWLAGALVAADEDRLALLAMTDTRARLAHVMPLLEVLVSVATGEGGGSLGGGGGGGGIGGIRAARDCCLM
ncbi:hypothetical protein MMPV_001271 [Pyropia vietnamensis]